jgi:hypothetical protein
MSTPGASASANTSENTAMASPSTPEANMLPDVDDKVRRTFYPTYDIVAYMPRTLPLPTRLQLILLYQALSQIVALLVPRRGKTLKKISGGAVLA